MKFYNKAITLQKLKVKNAIIPPFIFFKVKKYIKQSDKVISEIKKKFKNKKIIIRSSSVNEDTILTSNAGLFESVANVSLNTYDIANGIQKVIRSYKKNKLDSYIMIQEMILNSDFSGVLTTSDIKNLAPYYVINYSDGNDTSIATSGNKGAKNYYIFKDYKSNNKKFIKLIKLAKELEKKFNNNYLDLEFAVKKNKLYLFQVRPIVSFKKNKPDRKKFSLALNKLSNKIEKLKKSSHNLFGNTTFFGVMPDWNPAEIIGIKPKRLASSLYEELITDFIWAKNRNSYGFNDMTSNHLMTNFLGTPYVDVRVDFNSWIPENIDNSLKEKLISYYLNLFKKNKHLHDKNEFEILLTCFHASTEKKLIELKKNGFTNKEIKQIRNSLKGINKLAINKIDEEIKNIEKLIKKQNQVKSSQMYIIDKIYWYIEDCKKFGTYSFVGLARSGFIAVEILNSLLSENIISKTEKENFLQNIETITTLMIKETNLPKSKFCEKYGHLRPSTYDISSENYKDNYSKYIRKNKNKINKTKKFFISKTSEIKINKFLKDNFNFKISSNDLFNYIKDSIKYREYSKFVFTKSIDLIFEELKKLGKRLKIKKENLPHINIKLIKEFYYILNADELSEYLDQDIKQNIKNYNFNNTVKSPEVIIDKKDIFEFEENSNKPNFFGNNSVIAKSNYLETKSKINLKGRIVLINSADPGFDFIFNHDIKGLITEFGGANSHMSIRCSELNIPAAIGVGSNFFEILTKSKKIILNPIEEKIDII